MSFTLTSDMFKWQTKNEGLGIVRHLALFNHTNLEKSKIPNIPAKRPAIDKQIQKTNQNDQKKSIE